MRSPRFLTAAGSAVAATIALAALFVFWTPPQTVAASTILRSLKQNLMNGFTMKMERIQAEGVEVDGQMVVQFKQPINPADILSDDSNLDESNFKALYLEARVRTSADFEDLPGMELDTCVALVGDAPWIYLRAPRLPAELIEEEPAAAFIFGFAADGLLLDLEGVPWAEWLDGDGNTGDEDPDPADREGDSDDDTVAFRHTVAVKMELQTPVQPAAPVYGPEEDVIEQIVRKLVAGRLDGEQLGELVTLLEQHARLTVTHQGDGLYLLRADELRTDDTGADAAALRKLVIEARYREGVGVESLAVLNIGDRDGALRLEFGDAQIDPALLDKSRYSQDGRTRVLNVAGLMSMFHAGSGAE